MTGLRSTLLAALAEALRVAAAIPNALAAPPIALAEALSRAAAWCDTRARTGEGGNPLQPP